MGNKISGRRKARVEGRKARVEELFTQPEGLYRGIDQEKREKLRTLILEAKLAPCYRGKLKECPICFQYYPSLNRSKCCSKRICTECFIQLDPNNTGRTIPCPFCGTPNFAVEYFGVKMAAERSIEHPSVQRQSQKSYASNIHEDSRYMGLNVLECIVHGIEEPRHLELSLLQRITENFSDKAKIGSGGCGVVYKGILQNGVVAVKKLYNSLAIKDNMFHREVKSLITVKHPNIVRFLGYCSFTEEHAMPWNGEIIMANIQERLLCLEYVSNGSLDNYCTDELRGLEWNTRYQIIMGICQGLLYLHTEKGLIHMDLKPANILLDDDMVPKITDFGLSRLDNKSQTTTTLRMSPGYCAPEYFLEGKRSRKSDIYSLGKIIMELATGSKEEPAITKVLRRWRHRWIKTLKYTPFGYQQVKKCLELASRCTQIDPDGRPDILEIIYELSEIDTRDDMIQVSPCLDDMLGVEPLEVIFHSALDQHMSRTIELTNNTDYYIAFMITTANLRQFHTEPNKGIVPPQSRCSVTVTITAQDKTLLRNHYREGLTVQSCRIDGNLGTMDISGDVFSEEEGKVVDEVNVTFTFGTLPLSEEP